MNERFRDLVQSLDDSLQDLLSAIPVRIPSLPTEMPKSGIYVFFEDGRAVYVGRSNRMRARLQEHGRPSAGHNTAPFAFRLAREVTGQTEATYASRGSRSDLEKNPTFAQEFRQQKERVRKMDIRFVEEQEQLRKALLEIYVAVALDTKYNRFGTS